MRQMKRALSLILAMIMLLGMVMVPSGAASSSFIDADLIENTDAVTITSGIGLFAGTTDGRFAPKATVTRAQMATIIVKMLNGSDFNADAFKGVGVNPFPDTASFEGGWAEGYINACYQMGVVSGYGDGKFRPANELTTAEALTMIINALGVDPGQGEWPLNYMAKAEEMKLYGDLAKIPATDEPLNRDQLSVIVLAGLEYSPAGRSGWQIPGTDLVFEEYVDALKANGGNPEGVNPVVGDDALASKVYGLKKMAGFITGNQTTGLEYTELSFLNANKDDRETAMFGIESGLDLVGHYVTVYYKEKYTSEQKPGKTYAIVDESTAVTVKENIDNAKDYKTVFGQSYDVHNDYVVRITADYDLGKFCGSMKASEYAKGTKAIKGTYIIAGGKVRAYIDPVPTYATYISDVGSIQMEEYVSLIGVDSIGNRGVLLRLSMAEGDSQVIAYDGMKTGDFVTYQKVQNLYVISPVRKITGIVNKTAHPTINNSVYDSITVDGVEYMSFESNDVVTSNSFIGTKLDNDLSKVEFGTGYDLYLAEDGSYIGFEPTSGGVVLEDTVYLLGSFVVREMDQYGATRWYRKVRGINMSGEEVMLVQGSVKDDGVKNENGLPVYDSAKDTEDQLGSMATVLEGFYTVKEPTEKKEREEDIKVLTPFGASYSPETPTYALKPNSTSTVFTGTNTVATAEGIAAIGTTGMKFFVLGGSLTDSAPLTVSTGIPNAFYPTAEQAAASYMLVTRQPSGAMSNINIWIYRNDAKTGKEVPFYATQEQIDAPGENVDGKVYTVYSASTGKEMELILDSGVALTKPGMYIATQDSDGITFAIGQVNVAETPNFDDGKAQVVNNIGFWGLTTNRLRGERLASVSGGSGVKIDMINGWVNGAAGASVIDLRSEDEMRASGVGKITSLSQMVSLRESDPSMMIIYDLYMEDASNGTSGTTKTVFITRVVRGTVGMNSVVYAWKDPSPGDEMMIVRSLSATMGERVKVDFEVCRNGGPGFYRYCVDADGKLCLVPYDDKAVSVGSYGMYAMHEELTDVTKVDASTLLLTTDNAAHADCGYACTDEAVEPLKEFYITKATTTIMDASGKEIPFENFYDLFLNGDLLINYYCDTPVNSKNSTDKDTSAELVVISGRSEVGVSCDGSCQNGTPVASAADITGAGSYYLTGDISDISVVSGDVKLCLNGHSINGAITVDGGSLELTNCFSREGGQISKAVTVNGGAFTMNHAVTAKAGVTVAANGSFVMNGGKITGGTAGGVKNEGTFTMNGGKITGNTGTEGGGVVNSGTFNMKGGAISGNEASGNGGGVNNTGTFTMDDGSISANKVGSGKFGGGIYVNGGTVTMNDGTISGNSGSGSAKGLGVNIAKGTFTMNGGTITGHKTESTGGGIQVSGGTFNMAGGTITDNTAQTYGGGVCVQTGVFNMTKGTIAGNKVTNADGAGQDVANGYYGGAGGKITISGGTIGTAGEQNRTLVINANTATVTDDAVINGNVATTGTGAAATLNIKGGTFTGNVINGDCPNGGYLGTEKKAYGCTLNITDGTIAGEVTLKGEGDWTEGINRTEPTATITGGTFGKLPEGALGEDYTVRENSDGSVTVIPDACTKPGHSGAAVITADTALLRDEAVYHLTSNVKANAPIHVMGNVTLCLNGYTLTAPKGLSGAFISVETGKTLTICGGESGSGVIAGQKSGTGIQVNGTLAMESGIITDFADNAIKVASVGTVNMTGGVIRGNTGAEGGGVVNSGTFNMKGGVISENEASGNGGGVSNTGTFTMDGGSISANKVGSGKFGGGIYVNGGTVTMNGGEISGNTGLLNNDKKVTSKGLGVNIAKGTFTMNGGTITGHKTESTGGGIQVNGGTFNMAGGTITDNTAQTYGGGVCVQTGVFNMTKGTIAGNKVTNADSAGQDVANGYYGGAGGMITISGGTIGTAGEQKRTLVINANTAIVTGDAVINGNVATTGTGAAATLDIQGGIFTGNVINGDCPNGGYLATEKKAHGCTLNITGGTIAGEVTLKGEGDWTAGINRTEPTATITGGTFGKLPEGALGEGFATKENPDGSVTIIRNSCSKPGHATGTVITADTNLLRDSGFYYLSDNVTANGAIRVMGNVTLCLNSYALIAPEGLSGAFISVAAGKTLTICGGEIGNGVIVGQKSGTGIQVNGTLAMESGIITGFADNAIKVASIGTVNMTGGEIRNNTGTEGGGVYSAGDFVMTGGTIKGNTATSGGGVYLADGGHMTISGSAAVIGNTANTDGGGVRIAGGGTLTMNGGQIDNNLGKTRGGGVMLEGSSATKLAVLEMNEGSISHNVADHYGGGVSLRKFNQFTMNGGMISGNAFTGGNKYGTQITIGNNAGSATGDFIMNNGTIDGSGVNGYAVPLLQGTATIKGGTIIGEIGTVGALGGSCSLTIEGGNFDGLVSKGVIPLPSGDDRGAETLQVSGGIFNKTVSNAVISGGTFNAGVIGSAITGGTFTALEQDALAAQVDSAYKVEGVSGNLTVVPRPAGEEPEVPVVTTCALHGDHEGWTAISSGGYLIGQAGNYYISNNITEGAIARGGANVTSSIAIAAGVGSEVVLCLNGYAIAPNDATIENALRIETGNVTICNGCEYVRADNTIGNGIIRGFADGATARAIQLGLNDGSPKTSLTVERNVHFDGAGSTQTKLGGPVIQIANDAVLNLNDGVTIDNNIVKGNILTVMGGTVNINEGASISGNVAAYTVHAKYQSSKKPQITMNGGTISNNKTSKSGAAVCMNSDNVTFGGTFVMNGGTISGNVTTAESGGGVYLGKGDTFTMNDGSISNNTAAKGGGGVCLGEGSGAFILNGGTISGNTATDGGAVSIGMNATFTMTSGTVSGNTAKGSGAGLNQVPGGDGTVSITGGTLVDACYFGGTVEILKNVAINMALKNAVIVDCVVNGDLTNCTISGDNTVVNGIVTGGSISGGKFDAMINEEETLKGLLVAGKALEFSDDHSYWVVVDAPAAINESVEEI